MKTKKKPLLPVDIKLPERLSVQNILLTRVLPPASAHSDAGYMR